VNTEQIPEKKPMALKRKLISAVAMLLVSSILMGTSTYAWIVLSTAPEVTGITTNVGANGSLEVALLNKDTRSDLSSIRTGIDSSLAERQKGANENWGNLIDLGIADYGLGKINLYPARLSVMSSKGKYVVNSGLLSVPTYGYDGRIIRLTDDTMSAVYQNNKFTHEGGVQDYGVRAIGTADDVSAQASALAMARSNITTYSQSAVSAAIGSLDKNGEDLFMMMLLGKDFNNKNVSLIREMISDLNVSASYLDMSIRQGVIGFAASKLADETKFVAFRDLVANPATELSTLLNMAQTQLGQNALPEALTTWIEKVEAIKDSLATADIACAKLTDDSHTWAEIRQALDPLINSNEMFIGDVRYPEFDKTQAGELMNNPITVTLYSGSGVYADIADFTGDYETVIDLLSGVTIEVVTKIRPAYLTALSEAMKDLVPAGGAVNTTVELSSTYGYTLDLAFRSNAAVSDLLLQTTPEQRIYGDSNSASTMGGGSYMEFSSPDSGFSQKQMIWLMDAVRVAFVDDQNNLLAVAKLNTSNMVDNNGKIKAPLYLYQYSFVDDPDTENSYILEMGERLKNKNTITALTQNTPKAISVVVWLDGDIVDNTMVAAETSVSLEGVLNLQFASSAHLVPAGMKELMNYNADKDELKQIISAAKEIVDKGQGTYTSESWAKLLASYELLTALDKDPNASQTQIFAALSKYAKVELVKISEDALKDKIAEVRELVGTSTVKAFALKEDETDGQLKRLTSYPETEEDQIYAYVYRVDPAKNQIQVANDLTASIYTDATWESLALMLYDAEVLAKQYQLDVAKDATVELADAAEEPTEEEGETGESTEPTEETQPAAPVEKSPYAVLIDEMITALDERVNALKRALYYRAYEYDGAIYYFTVAVDEDGYVDEDDDTYGNWLDADFRPVISDKRIIDLDIRAELAEVAEIVQNEYVSVNDYDDWFHTNTIVPLARLRSDLYPEFETDEIYAVHWASSERLGQGLTVAQRTAMEELKLKYEEYFGYWYQEEAPVEPTVPEESVEPAAETTEGTEEPPVQLVDKYYYPELCKSADEILAADDLAGISAYNEVMEAMRSGVEAEATRRASNEELKVLMQKAIAIGEPLVETVVEKPQPSDPTESSEPAAVSDSGEESGTTDPDVEIRVNEALKAAIEAAEQCLEYWEKKDVWTYETAKLLLDDLNAELVAAGADPVAADVPMVTIPESTDKVVHGYLNETSMTYYTTGEEGAAKLTAMVLTKNGVLYKTEKDLSIYMRAGGAEIQQGDPVWDNNDTLDDTEDDVLLYKQLTLDKDETVQLSVDLKDHVIEVVVPETPGEAETPTEPEAPETASEESADPTEPDEEPEKPKIERYVFDHSEEILESVWVSTASKVADVDDNGLVTAKSAGDAWIQVLVKTVQGNEYTHEILISVLESEPEPEETVEPTE